MQVPVFFGLDFNKNQETWSKEMTPLYVAYNGQNGF